VAKWFAAPFHLLHGSCVVIESTLFFTLGFLCAGFLALMIAPAIWRRAVNLTRRRIEASVPLTLNEIQADKDKLRAEFAMSTRRLEMSIKGFKEKAAEQIAEIGRSREELKRLAAERDEKHAAITALEAQGAELRAELRQREDQLQQANARLDEAGKALEARALDLERLGGLYEEATFAASGRQIELVARESEIERLNDDLARVSKGRREFDRRLSDAENERRNAFDTLAAEKKRVTDLEGKVERMLSTLADREEKLERREKELARLRDQLKGLSGTEDSLGQKLMDAQAEKFKLEAQVAELSQQLSTMLSGAKGGDVEKAVGKLSKDRERLEQRLSLLTRENKRLRAELDAIERARTEEWSDERRSSALLREQINDLAAEVVNMTIMLEGKDSAAAKALAQPVADRPVDADGKVVISLADRVRALQKAAALR
jgi:chromosome segregation ATPase